MLASGFVADDKAVHGMGWYHPAYPAFAVEQVSGGFFDGRGERDRCLRLILQDGASIVLPAVEDMIADRLGQHEIAKGDTAMLEQARAQFLLAQDLDTTTDYDIRLSPTPMGALLARFGAEEAGTSGKISARLQMRGRGDSLHQSLATSNGRIAILMPAGTLTTGNVQLSEIDIGTFVQKMFEDVLEEPVEINCGLVAFTVRDGIAAADPILIDTKKNVILGRGGFSFRNESIDLAVRADAKTFSLFSGQSPVGVNGRFAQPAINPNSGDLVGRAGAGLGLAAVATPVAGLLAFIDPGDAKAAACGPVLSGARASAQRTAKGKPRDDVGRGTTAKSESGKQSDDGATEQRKKFLGIF